MCYMLYLGTDVVLPTSECKKEAPGFYLSDSLRRGAIKEASRHFSKLHVYYAGSHQGCGCGFFFGESDGPEEYETCKDSVRGLVGMIEHALASSESVELLVTWAGYEKREPKRRLVLDPEDILGEEFPLDEQDFVVFRRGRECAPAEVDMESLRDGQSAFGEQAGTPAALDRRSGL